MTLHAWSWTFLVVYVTAMLAFGWMGSKRVVGADDFATARKGYGPLILSLAFASTVASGATFLGLPGLAYSFGFPILVLAFAYPLGVYIGIFICQNTVVKAGHASGARSIPEYLGDRYNSELLRLSVAIFSLILLFYVAGQLVAGLVMFEVMLGLEQHWALVITAVVILVYVTLGGAHADILTDGAQALLMVALAVGITIMFFMGVGAGGFEKLIANLEQQDPKLLEWTNTKINITAGLWALLTVIVAHIPLGLLPHIGNKLWALKDERARTRFFIMAFTFGLILPAVTFGGLLARGVLGDGALEGPGGANSALPALFIELFPAWLAALLGVGVLSAIMSTADGLVISTSQVFANDIYRRSIAPRIHSHLSPEALDRNVLNISRVMTVVTVIGASLLGWATMGMNVVLLIWIGVGGFTAALSGPLVLGSIWKGVTGAGALAGFWTGAIVFILIRGGIISGSWFAGTSLEAAGEWFDFQATNPYSASTFGTMCSLAATVAVSKLGVRPRPVEATATAP